MHPVGKKLRSSRHAESTGRVVARNASGEGPVSSIARMFLFSAALPSMSLWLSRGVTIWRSCRILVHVMQQWPDGTQIDELMAFTAVAEHRSFSKAARTLGRDPTVLSRRIGALERRLGVRLLERTTRQVALTEAGATLLARAQTIRAALTDAEQEIGAYASGEPRGVLKVTLPTSFGKMWVAPYLSAFFRAYPPGPRRGSLFQPVRRSRGRKFRCCGPPRLTRRLPADRTQDRRAPAAGLRLAGLPRAVRNSEPPGDAC